MDVKLATLQWAQQALICDDRYGRKFQTKVQAVAPHAIAIF